MQLGKKCGGNTARRHVPGPVHTMQQILNNTQASQCYHRMEGLNVTGRQFTVQAYPTSIETAVMALSAEPYRVPALKDFALFSVHC